MKSATDFYKDTVLDSLADRSNVAQFVSFDPQLRQRYCRISGIPKSFQFFNSSDAISKLLDTAPEHKLNIRSFKPEDPQGSTFIRGLESTSTTLDRLRVLGQEQLFTIVNESIDVNDGGVSGVLQGGIAEFAPWQTPRCVEDQDVASLPGQLAFKILARVYGFQPELCASPDLRIEFSVHPFERGYKREKTLIWEEQKVDSRRLSANVRWPNDFSRLLGDKAFGLLLADAVGLPVPRTQVLSRHLPPFEFGKYTGSTVKWVRPCPTEKEPGEFTTVRGWTDPFALLAREDSDPSNPRIRSVLIQDEVPPSYSGAVITLISGDVEIDGVKGFGDELMLGLVSPEALPSEAAQSVMRLYRRVHQQFGPLRMEWVFDGKRTWIVQLQQDQSFGEHEDEIFPGTPDFYVNFDPQHGVKELRRMIEQMAGENFGVRVLGYVGKTSHIAERLTKARIPSLRQPRQLYLPLRQKSAKTDMD
jgi:hypothetical protein